MHLSRREKIGYAMGDAASNIVFQGINILLLYFYTDVVGVSPAIIVFVLMVVRIWDAFNDPIMGIIADRTQTRYGKYRPYLLWMAIPFGFMTYLTFSVPNITAQGKIIYITLTYLLLMMVYTAINVPYSALMSAMTPDGKQRTILSSYRFIGAFAASLVISMAARPMVGYFGGGQDTAGFDEAAGFRWTFLILAITGTLLFLVTFVTTRERVPPPKVINPDIHEDLRVLLRNKAWLIMALAGVLTLSHVAIRNAVTLHFFKYYVGDDGSAWFLFLDKTSFFLTTGSIALVMGLLFTRSLEQKFGKRNALVGLTILNALIMIGFFLIPPDAYRVMVGVNIIGSFLVGPTPALVWSIYADVADYSEWKSGRRSTGLVFSAAMFAQKMGLTVGGAGAGAMLAATGFIANQEQTPEALFGLRIIFCLVPGAISLVNGLILLLYPVKEEMLHRIRKDLSRG